MMFRERLHPSPLGILALCLVGPAVLIVLLPIAPNEAILLAFFATLATILLVWFATPVVSIAEGEIRAGQLRVPLSALGDAEVIAGENRRKTLGVELDRRAQLCTSPWVDAVVRITVIDPQDPTPYLIISSRKPQGLVEALKTR